MYSTVLSNLQKEFHWTEHTYPAFVSQTGRNLSPLQSLGRQKSPRKSCKTPAEKSTQQSASHTVKVFSKCQKWAAKWKTTYVWHLRSHLTVRHRGINCTHAHACFHVLLGRPIDYFYTMQTIYMIYSNPHSTPKPNHHTKLSAFLHL